MVMERSVFTVMVTMLQMVGLCPFPRKMGSFVFNKFSWAGAMCIGVAILRMLYLQTVIPLRILMVIDAFSKMESFEIQTSSIFVLCIGLGNFFLYTCWIFSVGKIFKIWNSIQAYDIKFNVKQPVTSKYISLWKQIAQILAISLSSILLYTLGTDVGVTYLQNHKVKWSLLFQLAEFNTIFAKTLDFFECLTRPFSHHCLILILVVFFSAIAGRIEQICDNLDSITETSGYSLKEAVMIIRPIEQDEQRTRRFNWEKYKFDKMMRQIQTLEEILLSFTAAWKQIFQLVSLACIVILSMAFFMLSRVILRHEPFEVIHAATIAFSFVTASRMIAMTNGAEALEQSGMLLKRKVLYISKIPGVNQTDIINMKLYVANLDFRISVGGYFVLKRSMLVSILSAIITYTVILTQFNGA